MDADNLRYDRQGFYDIDALDSHWADRQIADFIGHDKKILELGCATGYIGRFLKERRGCVLTGVELDEKAAQKAQPYYKKMIVGDLSQESTLQKISGSYDVILCNNVLEHLQDPGKLLVDLSPLLNDSGCFVIALPNVAHWSVRLNLLRGCFDYSSAGLLDQTHLRFFTLKACFQLLENSGLKVEQWGFDWDVGLPKFNGALSRLPLGRHLLAWFYSLSPAFFGYQFIFKARPIRSDHHT